MAFPGRFYAPPGVYTQTQFDNPFAGALDTLKIPIFVGEGNELLNEVDFELVRGSSSSVDQRVVSEDETGRAVVSVSNTGQVTLGDFDGTIQKFQVRNYPIVSGDGTGTPTLDRTSVEVTINGQPIVVVSVEGTTGIVEISTAPDLGDDVRCTYFFNRTDTLTTDDVSDQVTDENAALYGSIGIADINAPAATVPPEVITFYADQFDVNGNLVVSGNNVLILTVDGEQGTVTFPANDYTMAQVASLIGASGIGSLTASTFVNNFGKSALQLVSDESIVVGNGSANASLGLVSGQKTSRTQVFYTFNGPIVDGTNGGITTTDPANVTVKVNGVQVIPTTVDGQTRAVTLPYAPAAGSTVTIQYWFNTWQDTFDYLGHINITDIVRCGDVPGQSVYFEGADFILKDDKILWGTAYLISSGTTTQGATLFGENQVTVTLVDNRGFMEEATPVVDTSSGISVDSRTQFQLSRQPTLGNGRDTSLGQSLFQDVANGRIDVPVNRPDVVVAYWGYSVQDALQRGAVTVAKVEGSVLTLASPVPSGATVYVTQYYNILEDNEYTLTNVIAGPSGVGTYSVTDNAGDNVLTAQFDQASKGAVLTGVVVNFPSGSELNPDVRLEPVDTDDYTGPVEETVTVTFASREPTPAKYSVPGDDPYAFIDNQSDHLRVRIDGADLASGTAGLDLANPSTFAAGFFSSLVSREIDYTGDGVGVVGQSYEVLSPEEMNLFIDGVQIQASIDDTTTPPTAVTASHFVDRLNDAVSGHGGAAGAATAAGAVELVVANRSNQDGYYTDWVIVMGTGLAAGEFQTVTGYVAATGVVSVGAAWVGGNPAPADVYYIYDPAHQAQLVAPTQFDSATVITLNEYDQLHFVYTGDNSGPNVGGATIAPATYSSPTALATAVEAALDAAIVAIGAGVAGLKVDVSANGSGQLVFKLRPSGNDTAGYLEFINSAGGPATDFAILCGLSTAAATGGVQAKLLQGPVARYYTPTTPATELLHDRVVLRNRLLPGDVGASVHPETYVDQMELRMLSGSANTKTGYEVGDFGEGSNKAVVKPATLASQVGFIAGQVPTGTYGDERDGQPQVNFYDGTGPQPANDTFDFTLDGIPISVQFTSDSDGVATPLGPIGVAYPNTILEQIVAAIDALPGQPFGNAAAVRNTVIRQEGAGLRITSLLSSVSSTLVIGAGSSNAALGFTEGATVQRIQVTAKETAAALNANRHATFATWMLSFSTTQATYFAAEALAWIEQDVTNNEYLFIESSTLGAGSTIEYKYALVGGVRTQDALYLGTNLEVQDGNGASGEPALEGFYVVSNNPSGSGTANTSSLNNGAGQDGILGKTYRDDVTGLTFTILPRGFQSNSTGPWVPYPTGGTADFRINVRKNVVTNANLPVTTIPGMELTVANTTGVAVGDTAVVDTYERGGQEPSVGDVYYVSYEYQKPAFVTQFFTRLSAVETNYGTISPDNPVSLAAYLAMLNGAVLIGIRQVPKASGSRQASLTTYRNVIDELESPLPGQVNPDMIQLLRGDSNDLYQYLSRSNDKMSSIRYKSERTSIIGMSGGKQPAEAETLAQLLSNTRMRLVYPDLYTLNLTDATGVTTEYLVDGTMAAAALAGSVVSPNVDVATPWTGRNLVGFNVVARRLDAVEQNQLAQRGVTVLEERPPFLRVRHGLTTDMTNTLTRLPTIILIADEVQRQARATLDRFIGIKFLPGVLGQIEGALATMLKQLVQAQIISSYTGVKATPAADDPTVVEVRAYYQPVFPLLYIVMTFHLRSSL